MTDEIPQTDRSESAFSWTSDGNRHVETTNDSKNVIIDCRAYRVAASGKIRFDLWKPTLEARMGVRIEHGRMYSIRGTIDGIGGFESRHVGSANPHVYVFREGGGLVIPGRRYALLVETVEEKREFEVVRGSRGPCIRVTQPVLNGFGIDTKERSVVEMMLKRPAEGNETRVYAQWEPDWGFIQLYLASAGFVEGEVVQAVGGRGFALERFVEDFPATRVQELANVELGCSGQTMTLEVDGGKVPVEEWWLVAHGLKAVLKVKLGQDGRMVKFESDGEKCEARLMNSDKIVGFKMADGCLGIRYARTSSLVYGTGIGVCDEFQRAVVPEWLDGRVGIITHPNGIGGIYRLEMEDTLGREVRLKLEMAKSEDEFNTIKGDVGEDVVRFVLLRTSLRNVIDHPGDTRSQHGCRRKGPDFLAWAGGEFVWSFVESKWWEDVSAAIKNATVEARGHLEAYPKIRGVKVAGAYIAILDWTMDSRAKLLIERVK